MNRNDTNVSSYKIPTRILKQSVSPMGERTLTFMFFEENPHMSQKIVIVPVSLKRPYARSICSISVIGIKYVGAIWVTFIINSRISF